MRSRWGGALRAAALFAVSGLAFGCASVAPVDPAQSVSLGDEEGLVVLHFDTDVAIRSLRGGGFDPITFAEEVPRGVSIRMIRVEAGYYGWHRIEIEGPEGDRYVYTLPSEPRYRFHVKPGTINYPGQLRIRLRPSDHVLFHDQLDRSGQVISLLRAAYGELFERYGARYGGRTRHDFLESYTRAASAAREGGPEEPGAGSP